MKNFGSTFVKIAIQYKTLNSYKCLINFNNQSLTLKPNYHFCNKPQSGPLTTVNIPKQNLQIKHQQATVGQQNVDAFETKNAISILSKIKGTKNTNTGQLYALMFTCCRCNTQSIRSFTKNAYHNGVVLIRCQTCQNIHLVADNLGWFTQQPSNLQNYGQGKVTKVHDPVAIVKFIKAAFGDDSPQSPAQGQKQKQQNNQNKK